jgi:hypothetical protein
MANRVSSFDLPFRVALFGYLNEIMQLTDKIPLEEIRVE